MVAEETRKGAALDTFLAVWSRRKWLAIFAFAFPLAAGVSLTTFLPNIYRSTATVLVDRQQIPESIPFLIGKLISKTLGTKNLLTLRLRHLAQIPEGSRNQTAPIFRDTP